MLVLLYKHCMYLYVQLCYPIGVMTLPRRRRGGFASFLGFTLLAGRERETRSSSSVDRRPRPSRNSCRCSDRKERERGEGAAAAALLISTFSPSPASPSFLPSFLPSFDSLARTGLGKTPEQQKVGEFVRWGKNSPTTARRAAAAEQRKREDGRAGERRRRTDFFFATLTSPFLEFLLPSPPLVPSVLPDKVRVLRGSRLDRGCGAQGSTGNGEI